MTKIIVLDINKFYNYCIHNFLIRNHFVPVVILCDTSQWCKKKKRKRIKIVTHARPILAHVAQQCLTVDHDPTTLIMLPRYLYNTNPESKLGHHRRPRHEQPAAVGSCVPMARIERPTTILQKNPQFSSKSHPPSSSTTSRSVVPAAGSGLEASPRRTTSPSPLGRRARPCPPPPCLMLPAVAEGSRGSAAP
jgi:hypothetical protein